MIMFYLLSLSLSLFLALNERARDKADIFLMIFISIPRSAIAEKRV